MVYEIRYSWFWTQGSDTSLFEKNNFIWYTFIYVKILYPFWTSVFLFMKWEWCNLHHWIPVMGIVIFYVPTLRTGTVNCYSVIPGELLTKVDYWALPQSWTTLSSRHYWKCIWVYHDRLVYLSENTPTS